MSQVLRPRKPAAAPSYKGGHTRMTHFGYVIEHCPGHPACTKEGFVLQHRLVMEDVLGRYLGGREVVHHVNRDKADNRPENLQVLSPSEHAHVHNLAEGFPWRHKITDEQVREALEGRTTVGAAALLGVHPHTLYYRFDHLLSKRRLPHDLKDPATIEQVRIAAADPRLSYAEFAKASGIAFDVIKKICAQNGFEWVRKTRKGEVHRTYRGKPTSRAA